MDSLRQSFEAFASLDFFGVDVFGFGALGSRPANRSHSVARRCWLELLDETADEFAGDVHMSLSNAPDHLLCVIETALLPVQLGKFQSMSIA